MQNKIRIKDCMDALRTKYSKPKSLKKQNHMKLDKKTKQVLLAQLIAGDNDSSEEEQVSTKKTKKPKKTTKRRAKESQSSSQEESTGGDKRNGDGASGKKRKSKGKGEESERKLNSWQMFVKENKGRLSMTELSALYKKKQAESTTSTNEKEDE